MVMVLSQAHGGIEQLIYHHLRESSKTIDMPLLNCQSKTLSEDCFYCISFRNTLVNNFEISDRSTFVCKIEWNQIYNGSHISTME